MCKCRVSDISKMFSTYQLSWQSPPELPDLLCFGGQKSVRQPASITCLVDLSATFSNLLDLAIQQFQVSQSISVRIPIILHIITSYPLLLGIQKFQLLFTLERLPPKRSSKSVSPVWSVSWIKFRTTLPISESFCPNACRELARPCAQWFYCRVVISKTWR